jgi:succinate-acetate transporter protein
MSLFLMRVRGVKELNFLVGTMWFIAGTTNIICAVFELLIGNTFAWTIFGSLGSYFMSMGALLTPAFGVSAAYAKHPLEFKNAMGLFNCCWAAMFVLFMIVSIRTNIFMIMIFFCVSCACILSAVSDFQAAVKHTELAETFTKVSRSSTPPAVSGLISFIGCWCLLVYK